MKKAIFKSTFLLILFALTLSAKSSTSTQERQYFSSNKRETMKNVLEALEEGRIYESMPYWRENDYGFSFNIFDIPDFDYEWDFPEIRFNDEFIYDMQKRLEIMEEKIQERLQEMEKRIDSLNESLSYKYHELI